MKTYNNKSSKIEEWSTKYLKEMAKMYYDMIYGECSCYGSHDLFTYDHVLSELAERGITPKNMLTF